MARSCTICRHPEATEINERLAAGESCTALAAEYASTPHTMARHKREHLLTGKVGLENVVLTLTDVVNIPLAMKERRELTNAMLRRAMAPLFEPDTPPTDPQLLRRWRPAMERVQWGVVIALLKLQQNDEQTIIKITGIMRDEAAHRTLDPNTLDRYARELEAKMRELAETPEDAQALQQGLARFLVAEKQAALMDPHTERIVDNTFNGWDGD